MKLFAFPLESVNKDDAIGPSSDQIKGVVNALAISQAVAFCNHQRYQAMRPPTQAQSVADPRRQEPVGRAEGLPRPRLLADRADASRVRSDGQDAEAAVRHGYTLGVYLIYYVRTV
jgi:hypothetical protein